MTNETAQKLRIEMANYPIPSLIFDLVEIERRDERENIYYDQHPERNCLWHEYANEMKQELARRGMRPVS